MACAGASAEGALRIGSKRFTESYVLGEVLASAARRADPALAVEHRAGLGNTGIVLGALYGLLLFGDQIPLLGWAGMGVIMASGIAATVLRTRVLGQTPAEEH